jgi:sugar phosphate isomerase/epimerase
MKLAVSNIAWPSEMDEPVLAALESAGVTGVEAAPTRWWPEWKGVSAEAAKVYRQRFEARGFQIPALQAILFARPEDKLFGTDLQREGLVNHLRMCADLASALGARSLVFGAPKNRELNGIPEDKGFDMAREVFASVGKHYADRSVCLCLEANPTQYACQFMTNSLVAGKLVKAVDSPGVGLHLDTACMHLAGENIAESIERNFDVLRHFHASEPFLGSFDAPVVDHATAAGMLSKLGYKGWVSLEMRETNPPLEGVKRAISFLANTYGSDASLAADPAA